MPPVFKIDGAIMEMLGVLVTGGYRTPYAGAPAAESTSGTARLLSLATRQKSSFL